MPFTPFHLGPGLLIGMLFLKYLDLPALLVACVILDVEPLLVILTGTDYPLHGFFHTFLGGSAAAVVLSFAMHKMSGYAGRIARAFGISQAPTFRTVSAASFLGIYLHILLDAPLYPDIKPFFPIGTNPLFFPQASGAIYASCAVAFLLGVAAYSAKVFAHNRRPKPGC
ncbi:MAG: hydrolase [Candidatus Methanosuratincola petrocarbonis]|nr:hydrolase [Candidatus Methanosuratincola sp.]